VRPVIMTHCFLFNRSNSIEGIGVSEPGYYEDGKFGIRIENLVLVKKADTKVRTAVIMSTFSNYCNNRAV